MVRNSSQDKKACLPCARAKRKCGREIPRCGRCHSKNVVCHYPTRRSLSFFNYQPQKEDFFAEVSSEDSPEAPTDTEGEILRPSQDNLESEIPSQTIPVQQPTIDTHTVWFLSPDTWKVDHISQMHTATSSNPVLRQYPEDVLQWLLQWIHEGSNPFIHRELYRHHIPRCIQDAYTTLSTFMSRSSSNEEMIYRILIDRADQLLQDNESNAGFSADSNRIDIFHRLSQVHALIVYQTLGLFDTDIRLRYLAEQRIPILFKWADDMLDQASKVADLTAFQLPMTPDSNQNTRYCGKRVLHPPSLIEINEGALWQAWILAESVRRTWSVATGLQTIYLTIQQGWAACLGGTMVTTRKGVWDAESASQWAKLCSEVDVGFMNREQTERLFVDAKAEEVDRFGKAIMGITFGLDRLERWNK